MAIEDLKGGMKQALERGHSLEKIKQSFINSGYNPQEVEKAARLIKGTGEDFSSRSSGQAEQKGQQKPTQNQQKKDIQAKKLPQISPESFNNSQKSSTPKQSSEDSKKFKKNKKKPEKVKKPSGKKFLIIFLIFFLLLLITGAILIVIFREPVFDFFEEPTFDFFTDLFKSE